MTDARDRETGGFDRTSVADALSVAVRAPSIHNTQPWVWRLQAGELTLRADRSRQLAVADPDGHSLLLSCGAAMHRRSDRRPFAAQELSADVVEAVQAAAAGPGARVDFPKREDERIDLAVAVSWADRVQRDDETYKAEMNRWLRDPDVHALV